MPVVHLMQQQKHTLRRAASSGALRRVGTTSVVALFATLNAGTAFGFCRTTTCDQDKTPCTRNADQCLTSGLPLFWPDTCVTFGTHIDGSPRQKISYKRANDVAERAFQTWISADCGGGRRPSIGVVPRGKIYCDQVEFNHDPPAPNANLIVFRDDDWPYPDVQRTIALTTITFAVKTGEILDADIEVNSKNIPISTSDTEITSDLQSVLTHEIGHLFGLAHSLDPKASLNANYDRGDLSFRSLSKDDAKGICEIYPPGEADVNDCRGEGPRYGFSRYCGNPIEADAGLFCNVAAGRKGGGGLAALLVFAGLAFAASVLRHARRP